jgi:hypothetical protein|tara:strand:- start:171 stop:374 length:204 start_codon:yes stop_codon:yes gene_type:complete
MISKRTKMITAAIGIFFLLIFVLGLAESNTAGFAGFKSGLPFWMIALTVMAMVLYDFYDETACKSEG